MAACRDEHGPMKESDVAIDTGTAHSARVYDHFLGGGTNWPSDRRAAEGIASINPHTELACRECRSWVNRAIEWSVRERSGRGPAQIFDIGTGIPTSPNIHETAQRIDRHARVVYLDHDPVVLEHAGELLPGAAEGRTAYVPGDFMEGAALFDMPEVQDVLDLSQPVTLALNSLLHFVPDESVYDIVAAMVNRLAPGSLLMITQITTDFDPDLVRRVITSVSRNVTPARARSAEEFSRFFEGLELVEPGIVCPSEWKPAPGRELPDRRRVNALAAVGRIK
jgi:hypothetical protein